MSNLVIPAASVFENLYFTTKIWHIGRKSRLPVGQGDESPEFGVERTLMQIVPPDFVMFHNFKHQIACITKP